MGSLGVSKATKAAPGALESKLLVLGASLSSWDKAGCTCLSILARSLFQEKKLCLALGGAHRVPVPVTVYLLSVPDSQCEKYLPGCTCLDNYGSASNCV